MLTPESSATDLSDEYDLSLSQTLETHFMPHYNNYKVSNVAEIPVASDYEFAKKCQQFEHHENPDQFAKEQLLSDYNEAMKQIESTFAKGIARNEDHPAWQALGRFGTLSGFASIAIMLAQMLTDSEEKSVLATSTISVPSRHIGRVAKKSNKASKSEKDSTQQKQKQKVTTTTSRNHRSANGKRTLRKSDMKALASIVIPSLPKEDGHTLQDEKDYKLLKTI